MFENKQAIILGERDDVPGPTIRACLDAAGIPTVYETTACFV